MKTLHKKRVLLFILLLIGLTTILNFTPIVAEYPNLTSMLVMWIPGISAIVVAIVTNLSLKSFGWKFSLKWMALGWLIPIIYGLIAYSIVWLFGLGEIVNPTFLERAKLTLGLDSDNNFVIVSLSFLYITIVGLLPNMLFCLGEELGWRGFLVPQISKWLSLQNGSWISGVIWALWHLPGIVSGTYGNSDIPIWYQVFCFTIMVISTGVILAYLRMISKSIWPAVIFHAVHNGVIQRFFDRLTIDTGLTKIFIGEFGIVLALVTTGFAIYYYKRFEKIVLYNPKKRSKN